MDHVTETAVASRDRARFVPESPLEATAKARLRLCGLTIKLKVAHLCLEAGRHMFPPSGRFDNEVVAEQKIDNIAEHRNCMWQRFERQDVSSAKPLGRNSLSPSQKVQPTP